MMQLLCNGVVLDLYENTGFQLKDENPLFAFDKIACERTTNFKLPATPTNDRVLSLSRIPAYKGEGMRRKFAAQLQAGTVVKDGYLYVSSFDGKDYNAIFVTGELLGLQQIKDLGKLNEIMEYTETISSSYAVKPANDATFKTSVFDVYRYEGSEGVTIYPSINIGKLIDKICAHIGVQCATPEKTYEMRLACPSLRVPEKIEGAHIKSTRTGGDPYNTIFADLLARGIIEERVLVARRTLVWHNGYSVTGEVLETQTYDVNVTHFRTLDSIAITFPEDFPEGLFLCYMNPLVSGQCVFLGDYSFTRPTPTTTGEAGVVVSGEPLAGRTVEIAAGTSFILVREDGYAQPNLQNDYQCNAVQTFWGDDAIPAVLVTRGWDFVNGLQYDYEVDVDFNEEGATVYRLQDNLPDITFVELLKAVAAELGLVLRYSDADGLTFDSLPIDTYSVLEIGQILKRGEVTRTFADYAQRNAVRYKEDDVFANNETPAIYTIDNDNISEEKDLQVLPWTNGGQYISSAGVVVWDKAGRSEFLEIRYNAGGIAALRANISKNESIQRLCDASTQIKIESRMPLLQYERLKPDMGLLVDNLTYLWTDKQWQKDIVKLTLAQYAKSHEQPTPTPGYIRDGLVFRLDGIEKGDSVGKWKDLIGGLEFTPFGNVSSQEDCFFFPSSKDSWFEGDILSYPANSCTVEVCFECYEQNTLMILLSTAPVGNICAGVRVGGGNYACYSSISTDGTFPYVWSIGNLNVCRTLSMNEDLAVSNMEQQSLSTLRSGFSETDSSHSYIGKRMLTTTGRFYGKIYSIRIYNRKLSITEILHNQQVDNERFNLGL